MKYQNKLDCSENVLKIDLVANMYLSIKKGGMKIIFASLLPEVASGLIHQSTFFRRRQITQALRIMISKDARLHLFSKNSSTAVCDKIQIEGDSLVCVNLKIIDFYQAISPIYFSGGRTHALENFVLFGFYEINDERIEKMSRAHMFRALNYDHFL